MQVRVPYMARGPGQLTVPGGAMVFLFGEENRDGMATVIYDGQVRSDPESETMKECFESDNSGDKYNMNIIVNGFNQFYLSSKDSRTWKRQ